MLIGKSGLCNDVYSVKRIGKVSGGELVSNNMTGRCCYVRQSTIEQGLDIWLFLESATWICILEYAQEFLNGVNA